MRQDAFFSPRFLPFRSYGTCVMETSFPFLYRFLQNRTVENPVENVQNPLICRAFPQGQPKSSRLREWFFRA